MSADWKELKLLGRYIAQPGRHPVERVLWMFLCLTGFALAFLFLAPSQPLMEIHSTFDLKPFTPSGLEKYMNDPTTTGLKTTDYPIWNIDFPGVTICPNTKVKMYFWKVLFSQLATSKFKSALTNPSLPWAKLLKDANATLALEVKVTVLCWLLAPQVLLE